MQDWRQHPWAKGREAMLAAMPESQRAGWFQRRDEDDALYEEWLRGMGLKPGQHP